MMGSEPKANVVTRQSARWHSSGSASCSAVGRNASPTRRSRIEKVSVHVVQTRSLQLQLWNCSGKRLPPLGKLCLLRLDGKAQMSILLSSVSIVRQLLESAKNKIIHSG